MTKKKSEKQRVDVRVDVDTDRLYGSLDEAIRYLSEIRDKYAGFNICLDEHWTGYEDMEMTFVYSREETDEEMSCRLQREEWQRKSAEEEARRLKQRQKDLEDYERLRRSLGFSR